MVSIAAWTMQGRPYTLVLTKTGELFTREKETRHQAMTDLAWLMSAWGVGGERADRTSGECLSPQHN